MKLLAAAAALVLTGCLIPMQSGTPQQGAQPPSSGDPNEPATSPTTSIPGRQPATTSSAPAGPSVVSVTIRSECGQTVKVFYGDKPKYGNGTSSSISSHSSESHSFRPGDLFWIIDDSENGVTSVSVGPSTHEIDISSSCTTLSSH